MFDQTISELEERIEKADSIKASRALLKSPRMKP